MHDRKRLGGIAGAAVLALLLGGSTPARAEDEPAAPTDPTRGQWDSFLDPLRDVEDSVTDGQKWLEDRTGVHVGAGVTKSIIFNFNDPHNDLNTLHVLDRDHTKEDLDLFQIRASRPSSGWFIPGFGLTLDAGRIAEAIKSDWNGNGALKHGDNFEFSSVDVEEAYLTWTAPDDAGALKGLTLKGGKFVTLLGAEVIEPWSNFNFSRSFLFTYAIPFTHTGGLVTYPITDKLSATGGVVMGWDNVADNNDSPSFLGNLTWAATDMITLSGNTVWGPEQTRKIGPKRWVADLVATIKPTDKLTLLLNFDRGHEDQLVGPSSSALWQGVAAVANYQITDRASVAYRFEWFEDHNGVRTGLMQDLFGNTIDAKYQVTQHLYVRGEYRHDEGSKHVFLAGADKLTHGQDLVSAEFTYLWN